MTFFMPRSLARRDRGVDLGLFARDDDLAGGVEIGRLDVELRAQLVNLGAFLAHDRRHAAGGLLAGQLHEPAALGDDPQPGREIKHARRRCTRSPRRG
jgi:hypothetical protein